MAVRGTRETQERRQRLRRRLKLQEHALDAYDKATVALERAEQRRADTIKKLEEQVGEAKTAQSLALAVLTELIGDEDEAAALAYVEVNDVRAARKTHPTAAVRAAVDKLGDSHTPGSSGESP
jgi:hypothetical protein